MTHRPFVSQTVLDTTDVRGLAEFYRQLFGLAYRPGDETPEEGEDWLVLLGPAGTSQLAFQLVDELPRTTWPDPAVPMQLHLDTTVPDRESLDAAHDLALSLGATEVLDRTGDDEEPLWVLADPAGHPFCIFISTGSRRTWPLLVGERARTVAAAQVEDVPAVVALLQDDLLGATREGADLSAYVAAWRRIDADPAHLLAVVRDEAGTVVATAQLSLIPGLSRGATTRLQLEGVRVASAERSSGLGAAFLDWAHEWGRTQGAALAQLTTDRSREDAHRFYERLGYVATHEGMKRALA